MTALYKDPQGDNIFSRTTVPSALPSNNTQGYQQPGNSLGSNMQELTAEIGTLRKRVLELEQTLSELKVSRACPTARGCQFVGIIIYR